MKTHRTITPLVLSIAAISGLAAAAGIFYQEPGTAPATFTSVHGQTVALWGKGLYQHMSAELAPQGIAQDVVTLFIGIPLLLFSLWLARKGSTRGKFMLTGTLAYFGVTYLFYMLMGMYNALFLAYVLLCSLSFFAFAFSMLKFKVERVPYHFNYKLPTNLIGGFLIFVSLAIAGLWLSVVVPPLLNGSIVPAALEHYTTLVVQALDLALLLPLAFMAGFMLICKQNWGYLLATLYTIFLSLLMTALSAKVVAMQLLGVAVAIPVLVIIPLFNLASIGCAVLALKHLKEEKGFGHGRNQKKDMPKAGSIFDETEINLLVFTD